MSSILIIYMLLFAALAGNQLLMAADSTLGPTRPLVTALDHLSVIVFDEPVSAVAVGSSEFQVERKDNKVFVKPLKKGTSTNLLIWTASQECAVYEISVGDVASMNALIRNVVSKPAPAPDPIAQMQEVADRLIDSTLIASQSINAGKIKTPAHGVGLRIDQVFTNQETVYVHYSLENFTSRPYRIPTPIVFQLRPEHLRANTAQLKGRQLDHSQVEALGATSQVSVPLAHADAAVQDVLPGSKTAGVVAFRLTGDRTLPTILRMALDSNIQATLVF